LMATATMTELNLVLVSTRKCGFCADSGNHSRCPGGTRSGTVGVRICPCDETERCGQKRCLKCNIRRVDEIGDDWTCIDRLACETRIQERLAADPQYQQMTTIRKKAAIMTAEAKAEKPAKVEKVGTCLVTGKPTKGGLFAPGQDAKYVSLKVAEVAEANFTKKAEDAALKTMKSDGVSEKLQAKFTKAVGLAKARAEKAKEAAAAKAAEKAEKAKA
jgi:hypothetical protein